MLGTRPGGRGAIAWGRVSCCYLGSISSHSADSQCTSDNYVDHEEHPAEQRARASSPESRL